MKKLTQILILTPLFALTTLLVTPSASADTLLISRGGGDQVISDEGYDFLSEDQFTEAQFISVQYSILYELYAGLEFTYSEETFDPVQQLSSDLDVYGFLATVRLEHQVTSWFVPYLQLGVGAYNINLKVDLQDETREQNVWEPGMVQFGGLELMIPRRYLRDLFKLSPSSMWWDFTAGLGLEAGYQSIGTVEFNDLARPDPEKKPDPEDELLSAAPIDYGSVDLSGFMLRFGLHLHF